MKVRISCADRGPDRAPCVPRSEQDDLPDVRLEELLDELTIGGADEPDDAEGGAGSSAAGATRPAAPVSFAPPAPPAANVAQFELPGGNENAKFFF